MSYRQRQRAPSRGERDPALWALARRYLAARGLDADLARRSGWYVARFSDGPRLVVPTTEPGYWQARALDNREPRYVSAPAPRRGGLVVVAPSGRPARLTCVVEGPMDALAAAGAGAVGIAVMGTAVPPAVGAALKGYASGRVVVVVDTDTAALARSVLTWLPARVATTYPAKDLAAATPEQRRLLVELWLEEEGA